MPHSDRQTTASTLRKVAVGLRYYAACVIGICPSGCNACPKKDHQTVEAKQERGCVLNGQIRPLVLGLDTHMSMPFLKGYFQTPALHEVFDNLFCRLGKVSGKDRFGG